MPWVTQAKVNERWQRWLTCSLCEQEYHGLVGCALGWACWKTYAGRPEEDMARRFAMSVLGNGLSDAKHHKDALSVREAELSLLRRIGAPQNDILLVKGNLANTYQLLERREDALTLRREVYSECVNLHGEEHFDTIREANNYASSLHNLRRFEEAKALFRKMIPVARRLLGESHHLTLTMRWTYALTLYRADGATLDDLCVAVTTLEETKRIARRVLGGAHPLTKALERHLGLARAALRAREAPPPPGTE